MESNWKTMKSAAGKRPPDGESGPGKEAIRLRQLCLEESRKGGCTLARCSTSGTRDCADSKDDACDARHSARKVQIARCSASTSKNCKISFFYPVSWITFAPFRIKKSAKFRQNFIKIWAKISKKNAKITKFCKNLPKNAERLTIFFLKYWGLSGAKACKSCRSRQELSRASIQQRTSLIKFDHLAEKSE